MTSKFEFSEFMCVVSPFIDSRQSDFPSRFSTNDSSKVFSSIFNKLFIRVPTAGTGLIDIRFTSEFIVSSVDSKRHRKLVRDFTLLSTIKSRLVHSSNRYTRHLNSTGYIHCKTFACFMCAFCVVTRACIVTNNRAN